MPVTLHKILVHGADIINILPLPVGLFSEEGGESRNKHIRNYREFHARKASRDQTIGDQFRRLLLTSDPLVSTQSKILTRARKPLTAEMLQYIREEYIPCNGDDISEELRDEDLSEEMSEEDSSDSNTENSNETELGDVSLPSNFYNDDGGICNQYFYRRLR